jgi:hypothetical protein
MRRVLGLVLAAGAVGAGAGRVWASDKEALAVVEKAIKAHGGEDALRKALACSRTDSGKFVAKDLPFTSEVTRSLPGKVRMDVELDKRFKVVIVLNGDKGWEMRGGPSVEMGRQRLNELREEAYVLWLTTLVPLRKAPFDVTPLPEAKVNGQPALGVKVRARGHPDSNLYFSKRTGLLVKVERRATDAGVPVDKEYLYSGHKDFGGARLPTREVVLVNGKRDTDVTVRDYKFLKKVEEGTFGRP